VPYNAFESQWFESCEVVLSEGAAPPSREGAFEACEEPDTEAAQLLASDGLMLASDRLMPVVVVKDLQLKDAQGKESLEYGG